MSSLKKYPLFVAALSVGGLIALGEGGWIFERWRASRDAAVTLEKKKNELHAMGALAPAPSRAVATAIEADLARAQRALETMQGELKGRGPAAERLRTAKVPAARTDAYFDLATFVEKMRELAKTQDVTLKPEAARLGFARYAKKFRWPTIPMDELEQRLPPKNPLLPYLEKLARAVPPRWDNKLKKYVPNDEWLLWDLDGLKKSAKKQDRQRDA